MTGAAALNPALPTVTRTFVVNNRLGLHARPCALLVKTLRQFDAAVTVQKGVDRVDAKSILGVMTLAATLGTPSQRPAGTPPRH